MAYLPRIHLQVFKFGEGFGRSGCLCGDAFRGEVESEAIVAV